MTLEIRNDFVPQHAVPNIKKKIKKIGALLR